MNNPIERKPSYIYTSGISYELPEVSIITPFYNVENIFKETLFCVLNQSFQNFEWIIVDDCSSNEASLFILKEAALKDARIKILYSEANLGPGAARNKGIKYARGKYLFFVDADDLLEYTIIEKYWLFLNFNNEFAFCNAWHYGFGSENYIWKKGFETARAMLNENVIQPTFMARRVIFQFVEFNETIRDGFEDWDFWLQCAAAGLWGYTLQECLYWYRRSENAVAKWQNWDMGEKMNEFQKGLKKRYEKAFLYQFPSPKLSRFSRGLKIIMSYYDNL
ncbi:MAG: glycosyltransferase family A protein [Bacteroidota bacterium]